MLSWLNNKTEFLVKKYHEPLNRSEVLQYILLMILGAAISCCIRLLHVFQLPTEILPPPADCIDAIFRILLAPTTEEFITRIILLYFISIIVLRSEPSNISSGEARKMEFRNTIIIIGAIISALFNSFFLMQGPINAQYFGFIGYIVFLGTSLLLFRQYEKLSGLIFFVFLFGSCFFFAALHQSRQLFAAYLSFALLNSYWTIKTRSICMPIVMHIYINTISTILAFV